MFASVFLVILASRVAITSSQETPRPSATVSAKQLGTIELENFGNQRYCGVYSVVVAAKMLGKELQIDDFLDNKYVTSVQGSTISDICKMLELSGLRGEPLSGGTAGWLELTATPTIIHIRGQLEKATVNHWVVSGGGRDNLFRVVDGGNGDLYLTRAELLAVWDGIGIAVSKAGDGASGARFAMFFDENVQLLFAFGIFIVVFSDKNAPIVARLFFGLAVSWAIFAFKSDSPFLNLSAASAARASTVFQARLVDSIGSEDLAREIEAGRVILVDARTEKQYSSYHIPSAISLPIDASILDYIIFARTYGDRRHTVVTYCNSYSCIWAERVAKRLSSLGMEVKVFSGGIAKWTEN